ncbi:MAG: ATP-binding cassette protein [Rickettsiaceae bacterium]|jgi:ATPase subunit of ABC transporter with duplicated ATPase domains|nr:ATP-binding cassette protein [Rickettsiaceae bacterium]
MLSINNLIMQYGGRILFHEVNLNILKARRYGVVGANGTGKSTFLRILSGEETPSDGEINLPKNTQIGFLKQNQFLYENVNIIDIVLQGKQKLWQAMKEKDAILAQEEIDMDAAYKLSELEEIILLYDGYTAEYIAQEILVGLGIKEEYHFQPLSVLSGGYKLRVLLAQTLFSEPDIMLLDEPTNHLDIVTIAWLEQYLINNFKGALVVISHDRSFLNNLCTHILDIDYGEIREYTGNYDKFEEQKAVVAEHRLLERKNLEKKIAQLQLFVDRFGAKATKAAQARSKEKMIARIELPDIEKSSRCSPGFNFNQKTSSGKVILQVEGINKSFEEKIVLKKINFKIIRGEKALFIGPNGIGKSTLLKVLLDKLKADSGSHEWGLSTKISYFAQDHHELLNKSCNVFDWLCEQCPDHTTSKVRSVLGAMLFRKDDVEKDVLSLSGGEAARLLFAKIMLEESNVLVLDEPTNHLDVEAIEALSTALQNYNGTLLLVSHDRYFATKLADRVIALTEKGMKDFAGTYSEYLSYYGDDYLNSSWLKQNKF